MNCNLPVHPRTGLTAVGIVGGKPVWPILGGAPTVLETLEARQAELRAESQLILDSTEGEATLRASDKRKMQTLSDSMTVVNGRIIEERERESRRAADADVNRRFGTKFGRDGVTTHANFGSDADVVYRRNGGHSYFRDLVSLTQPGSSEAYEAQQRLSDHAQMIERAADDLPREFRAGRDKRAAGSPREFRVNPNRTDGQGGNFVPPLWLIDDYVPLLRAGRATADRCNVQDLPTGTDVIMLPKVATGTSTAVQTADAGAVSSTDLTDTSLSGPVRTIAGQQDVALQLIDQSPSNFDEVVFADLIADYNQKLDVQVLNGSGASGQLKGILQVSGISAVTYTDASPSVPELYTPLTQALSLVARLRFLGADSIVMAPQRWWWIVAALDTQNRPLVTPEGADGMNSVAVYDPTATQGVAGSIAGVPIVVDPNQITGFGSGTNQDRILVGRLKDVFLYEGALRTRALMEILSGTLQVRLQVYNYVAQIADRYATAFATIDGTGLITPAGY